MGREIRRVPPNWEHPRYTAKNSNYSRKVGEYMPMHDQDYEEAAQEWIDGFNSFTPTKWAEYYWEDSHPPEKEFHRPKFTEEPTWYQVYETVSEGTPVSPPFATLEELAQHLAKHGDDWSDGKGWGIERAEAFCRSGFSFSIFSFSMMIDDGQILESKDIPLHLEKKQESDDE